MVLVAPIRLVLDPEAPQDGHHHQIGEFLPSWDGRFLAYNVETDGGESGPIMVLNAETGKSLDGEGTSVRGGAYLCWLPDNSGFLYHRSTAGPSNHQVRLAVLHALGTPLASDIRQ